MKEDFVFPIGCAAPVFFGLYFYGNSELGYAPYKQFKSLDYPQANRKKSVASFSKAKLAIFVVLNRAHELNLFELGEREGTMEKKIAAYIESAPSHEGNRVFQGGYVNLINELIEMYPKIRRGGELTYMALYNRIKSHNKNISLANLQL